MTLSFDQAAANFRETAVALQGAKRDAVRRQALQATTIIRASIREAVPSGKLTPRRVPVGAGFRELGSVSAPYAEIRPRGPIGLVEGPIRPHEIRPRRGRGASGKKALGVKDRWGPYTRVSHPGTKGKRPWAIGVDRAVRAGGTAMIGVVSDRMLKVWTR